MANPTTALTPVALPPIALSNTTAVQIAPSNPTRNGLLVSNTTTAVLWIGPSTVVFVAGTQVQGSIALAAGASIFFGALSSAPAAASMMCIPWVWSAAMFAMLATSVVGASSSAMEF